MSDAAPDGAAPVTDSDVRPLLEKLSSTYNVDFRDYKEPSLVRRIRARMSQVHVEGFEAYARYLDLHPEEHVQLFNTILINVTGFFRDPEAWHALGAEVLPRLVTEAGDSRSIRIWSAGCSSGEETYSIAILLAEQLGAQLDDYNVKLYATDIDEEALTTARHAAYRLEQLKDIPDERVERYFTRDGQIYRVRHDLRRWCIFGGHNLVQAPPLSHIDLLVCRNVLIYFTAELQERILARFHYSIRENGHLFLGRSESLLARSRLFAASNLKWRIFLRMPSTPRQVAAVLPDRLAVEVGAGEHHPRAEPLSAPRALRALEALPVAVMIVDLTDTILAWNTAAEQLFDLPSVAALGKKFRDLDMSYRVEGLRARIEEVKTRHMGGRMDNGSFTRRNGELVHAEISVQPLLEGQRLIGVLVSVADATEYARLREQMSRVAEQHATAIEELQSTNEELETTNEELQSTNEELETTNEELQSTNEELETTVEELQAANTQLVQLNSELEARGAQVSQLHRSHASLVNSLEQGIVVVDRSLIVVTWNQAVERMWALRAEQALGRELTTLPIGDVVRAAPVIERVLATGHNEDLPDVVYTIPGGEKHRVTLRLTPLRSATGDVTGVIVLLAPAVGEARSESTAKR